MRRKTRTCSRQVLLFAPVALGDAVPTERKGELIRALADLLLEAGKAATREEGGRDDEHEGDA